MLFIQSGLQKRFPSKHFRGIFLKKFRHLIFQTLQKKKLHASFFSIREFTETLADKLIKRHHKSSVKVDHMMHALYSKS